MAEEKIRVLYAGDGETVSTLATKGMSFYMSSCFEDGSKHLKAALATDPEITVDHIKPWEAMTCFPHEMSVLNSYQVIILSDIGADSILLYENRNKVPMGPNRLKLIRDWANNGGGFLMIGGWASFGGWGGQARYADTHIEEILPVAIKDGDDRVEVPEGCHLEVTDPEHPLTKDLPWTKNLVITGYNRIKPKTGAKVIVSNGRDPLLVVGTAGKGKAVAFATECAPPWAGTMLKWEGYAQFWVRMIRWLAGKYETPKAPEPTK